MRKSDAVAFAYLRQTVPAVRCRDGGAQFSWHDLNISVNAAGLRILNALDGSTAIPELVAREQWDLSVVREFIRRFIDAGLIIPLHEPQRRARRGWIKTTRLSAVSVEIIQQCNQNCVRCYLTGIVPEGNHLSLSELEDLFRDLKWYGVTAVCLSGGEPFMRSEWPEIVRLAVCHDLQVSIATNSTFLSAETLARIRESGVAALQISVDGTEATHDATRQSPGSFIALKKVFHSCARAGVPAFAITSISRENASDIPSLNSILREWGAVGHIVNRYVPTGVSTDDYVCSSRQQFESALVELRDRMAVPVTSCDPVINHWLGRKQMCGAGYYGASVSATGMVKICDTVPHDTLGNVRNTRIGDAFERSPLVGNIVERHQEALSNNRWHDDPCYGCLAHQTACHRKIDGEDPYHFSASTTTAAAKTHAIGNGVVPYVKIEQQGAGSVGSAYSEN